MNYYLMSQDMQAHEVPRIIDWYGKMDMKSIEQHNFENLPQVTVLEAKMAPNISFHELVFQPILLLPKEAARLLQLFEPWIETRDIVLVSQKKDVNHRYVFPLLQESDCLSKKSYLNRDRTIIEKGILVKDKIPNSVMFMPQNVSSRNIIVREDFVECLLQENFFGFKLIQLEIDKEG